MNDFNSVKPHVLSTEIKSGKLVVSSDSDTVEIPGSYAKFACAGY